jgi:hypothetical protein
MDNVQNCDGCVNIRKIIHTSRDSNFNLNTKFLLESFALRENTEQMFLCGNYII